VYAPLSIQPRLMMIQPHKKQMWSRDAVILEITVQE